MDEVIGHMRARVSLPPWPMVERVNRVKPSMPPEWYNPYERSATGVAPMAPFGEGYRYHVTGLVHDMDYERWPDMTDEVNGHPRTELRLFAEWGWPEELIQAVAAHAEHMDVAPETLLARALRACDEITGLIIATALVRPSKDIRDVRVKSVKKKWKDKSFTAAIDRDEIAHNVAALGEDLNEHITLVLEAMRALLPS
jgi:predicted hydrolase (HD superfamily)